MRMIVTSLHEEKPQCHAKFLYPFLFDYMCSCVHMCVHMYEMGFQQSVGEPIFSLSLRAERQQTVQDVLFPFSQGPRGICFIFIITLL